MELKRLWTKTAVNAGKLDFYELHTQAAEMHNSQRQERTNRDLLIIV